jgi:hypothetical protein
VPVDEPPQQVGVGKFSGALVFDHAAEDLQEVAGHGLGPPIALVGPISSLFL